MANAKPETTIEWNRRCALWRAGMGPEPGEPPTTNHESPAWEANTRLNAKIEICYLALDRIIAEGDDHSKKIAIATLEAAANVR